MTLIEKTTKNAIELLEKMQRIVEDRQIPIMESYQKDFYVMDKNIIAEHFTPNSRFLWLMHPCGSHLGRIGVLPDEKDMMKAVLNTYVNSYDARRMELNAIDIDGNGEAKIKKIGFSEGHNLLAKKDFEIVGNSLFNQKNKIATIDVKLSGQGGQYYGHAKITSINEQAPLDRSQTLAAVMMSSYSAATQSGSLFTSLKSIEIDGKDLYVEMAALDIPDLSIGKYAPIISETESSPYTSPRQRA